MEAVLFDIIGTTVKENSGDVILKAFDKAFLAHVQSIDLETIKKYRGKDKRVMISEVLKQHAHPLHLAEAVYNSFKEFFEKSLEGFFEMDGAEEIFTWLKDNNIKVGIGTGLERDLFDKIYQRLGWAKYSFDYIGTASEVNHSRPHPQMILEMMKKLGVQHKRSFLKVGDTIADIQEGKNAGVLSAVMLTGSQPEDDLKKENPDYILESLLQVKDIVQYQSTLNDF